MKLLVTLGKLGTKDEFVQGVYSKFSSRCLKSRADILSARQDFHEIGDMFLRKNELDNFCDKTIKLSEQLKREGNTRLSDLLINELSKMCMSFNKPKMAKELLNLAIENSRKKNDGLHELARLIDLEKLYKETNDKKALMNILGQKKDCCKRIIKNYEENAANYDSILKTPTPKEGVQVQLAFAYSDLAGMIEKRKPQDAIKMYEKSKEIYRGLNRTKEIEYLERKISKMQEKYKLLALHM